METTTKTELKIDGITYEVLKTRPFEHNGKTRFSLMLKRPNGKKAYFAVRYENGSLSSVVGGF